ncbi:hypothetical protein [Streptomyces pimonensis]|uniref:hypothetical protein n=1 Tax=Streptomyces pimonensis TaxID=2860288 RepID=UPI003528A6A4
MTSYAVVIPTPLRENLADRLAAPAAGHGPRTRREVTTVPAAGVVIPPAATWHRPAGAWRHRDAPARREAVR